MNCSSGAVAAVVAALTCSVMASDLQAQDTSAVAPAVVCSSKVGERQTCAADTQTGVTLLRSTGAVPCALGTTWGFDQQSIWVSDGCSGEFSLGLKKKKTWGTYTPTLGFKVANTDHGTLSIKLITYLRYLNELGLDPSFVDAFGITQPVDRRQDIQLQKLLIQFLGWALSPKFNYFLWVWSANTNMGLGAQVVLGGNLQYTIDRHLTVGGGIRGLPGVRSTEGNWPNWLGVDNRLIADEFFRPSYTTGVWILGNIVDRLSYTAMLGNNLSQLGVDAGQLDIGLNTVSVAVTWLPTTGEFGFMGQFGDFDYHKKAATRLAGRFTTSKENYQSQPDNDNFENVQIRLSNGGIIFAPNLFGPGIRVQDALYQMADVDMGVEYHGFSLEGEYYWRWVSQFTGPNTAGLPNLFDHGFQLQASAMAIPRTLQIYVSGSKIFGEYGNPSDFRIGANWYPFKNQVLRWNAEFLHLNRSPVGGLSLPYPVGGNGPVFYTSLLLNL